MAAYRATSAATTPARETSVLPAPLAPSPLEPEPDPDPEPELEPDPELEPEPESEPDPELEPEPEPDPEFEPEPELELFPESSSSPSSPPTLPKVGIVTLEEVVRVGRTSLSSSLGIPVGTGMLPPLPGRVVTPPSPEHLFPMGQHPYSPLSPSWHVELRGQPPLPLGQQVYEMGMQPSPQTFWVMPQRSSLWRLKRMVLSPRTAVAAERRRRARDLCMVAVFKVVKGWKKRKLVDGDWSG